jgi:uncharacterized repeat protein (TIGR03803 family)
MQIQLIRLAPKHAPSSTRSIHQTYNQWRPWGLLPAIALGLALFTAMRVQGQTLTTLYGFLGYDDGWFPTTPVLYVNGNLYGTTQYGDNDTSCNIGNGPSDGCGTVYEISASGAETLVHVFTGSPDGMRPESGLIQDSAGNFYGTTFDGGAYGNATFFGYGTVYKIDGSGNESVLYSFAGSPDGDAPIGNLVMDSAGNLYGATQGGGTFGFGTVFKLDATGNETVLYNFAGPPTDGETPMAGLVMDAEGNLYGTTNYGGNAPNIGGAVFKLDTTGHETVLYNFTGEGDGYRPMATLVLDSQGNLYGTAYYGGYFNREQCGPGCGTVFRVDGSGKFAVLHRFKGGADGANPAAGLLRSTDGKFLYGTTVGGGTASDGTVFQVSASGESVLFSFPQSGVNGWSPSSSLTRDSAGNLCGTTIYGGPGWIEGGTVFKLTP